MVENQNVAKDYCDVERFTVGELVDAALGKDRKRHISIPRFQRSIVWTEKKTKDFVDSIKSGYPFGAILLSKAGQDGSVDQFNLIDGLQRTNTLVKYVEAPTSFFDDHNLEDEECSQILKRVQDILVITDQTRTDALRASIVAWTKNVKGFEEADGYSSVNLAEYVLNDLQITYDKDLLLKLKNEMIPLLHKVKQESDVKSVKIPVIIYRGPGWALPQIFERLNRGGTTLSKYQVFAAAWARRDCELHIENPKILELIRKKYEAVLDRGYDVDQYDPESFNSQTFNMYEYVFGFSKLMSQKYPDLIGSKDNPEAADTCGFNLLTACLSDDSDITQMGDLPGMVLAAHGSVGQAYLENVFLDSIRIVHQTLDPVIGIRANSKGDTPPICHAELQIVAMIGKVFISKYDKADKFKERDSWPGDDFSDNLLLRNIRSHYLYEILSEEWRGTGNITLSQRVQPDSKYDFPVTKEMWENRLKTWHMDQLAHKEKDRATTDPVSVLFLKYIYSKVLNAEEDRSWTFELEHLVPVSRLKALCKGDDVEGLPISAVANLALIPKKQNRRKRDLTIYEYRDYWIQKEAIGQEQADEWTREMERFTFTKEADLDFAKESNLTREAYVGYLNSRFSELKRQFFEKNRIP